MKKVELIKWNYGHSNDLIKISNLVDRSYLSDRLPYPYNKDDANWWLDMVNKNDEKEGLFRAIVVDGVVVGNISVEKMDDVHKKNGEIGYLLLDEYKSQGIMTEAVKQMCELAFDKLDIIRISASVFKPNIASIKVLLKNDFIKEGEQAKVIYKNECYYDQILFGKIR